MKGVSLWQPWATFWVLQLKKYETRSWPFPHWYTGPVAIHAAQKKIKLQDYFDKDFHVWILNALNKLELNYADLPRGALIGVCDSIRSYPITKSPEDPIERRLGDWTPGRYYWKPQNIRALAPVPFSGSQSIFNVDDHIVFSKPQDSKHKQLRMF